MSVRKRPGQPLKGTASGNASGSGGALGRALADSSLRTLQDRVVGGAVESAVNSLGGELAALSR